MEKKKYLVIIILVLVLVIGGLVVWKKVLKKDPNVDNPTNQNAEFDYKVIYETNNLVKNQNYLISPLSMGYALSLLNEGADGNTKAEIDKVLNGYTLPNVKGVLNRIGIANLLFVRDKYQNEINPNFISALQTKYNSDVMFDPFVTPQKANDWIKEKTYNMIPEAIGDLTEDFVLGVANTIAIDVEWKNKFQCTNTAKAEFTKVDGTKMDVAMMRESNDVAYIENTNAKGIVKDYMIYDTLTNKSVWEPNDNTVALEYIAIMPNEDINEYLKKLNGTELKNLLGTKKTSADDVIIHYALPKYTYDYTYTDFQKMLNNLGMKEAFDPEKANLKKMVNDNSELELYVSKSIHKTHIELSENGTKAAAVTAFIVDKAAAFPMEKEIINIEFNKPFIYIIKEKKSDNIWFFGAVYEPMKWADNKGCNIQ